MLRGSDKSKSELIKQLEENEKQLQRYETKLKDVVRAYKSLNAEKEALQTTVVALTGQSSSRKSSSCDSNVERLSDDTIVDDSNCTAEERVELLKKSLTTLIAEKSRREAAFQADKKALLAENDSLREKLQKTAAETEAQAEELERRIMSMGAKMKRIEEDRERELADHGSVLAEMQQRYAKERANVAQMERQIAELYKKLQGKETDFSSSEEKYAAISAELKTIKEEKEKWRLKAEKTLTVQVLESELQNLKIESQKEIEELRTRLSSKMTDERESRLHELEERLHIMSKEMANVERVRAEEKAKLEKLQQLNEKLEKEKRCLSSKSFTSKKDDGESSSDTQDLKKRVADLVKQLKTSNESIDIADLGVDEFLLEERKKYEQLYDEFERYKLKAQAVLKGRDILTDFLDGSSFIPRISSLPTVMECASCVNAEADLRHTRSVIASLHEKLQTLEIDHANAKREYEEKCTQLRQTIMEMQTTHENLTTELRHEMQRRVADMEAEMQKQRNRTLDILAEKEEELEMVKTVLVSVRSQKIGQNDPVDPPQGNGSIKQHAKVKKTCSRELAERTSSIEETSSDRSISQIPAVSSSTEAKNIFYEQELAKKDKLIAELRTAVQVAEFNARDAQQSALTKDLLNYEMVEKLKEEINVLEGKLNFHSGDANMEYLRNIFIQLLHCESSSGRKHILKAIGTVLKLSQNELRHIDKR